MYPTSFQDINTTPLQAIQAKNFSISLRLVIRLLLLREAHKISDAEWQAIQGLECHKSTFQDVKFTTGKRRSRGLP